MAGKLGGSGEEPMTEINIVPLVDIVLVVLIIFMVTATYIVTPSIKVNLPEAATGENVESSSLGITVAAEAGPRLPVFAASRGIRGGGGCRECKCRGGTRRLAPGGAARGCFCWVGGRRLELGRARRGASTRSGGNGATDAQRV